MNLLQKKISPGMHLAQWMPLIFLQLHDGLIWPCQLFCFEAVLSQSWALYFQEENFVARLRLLKNVLLEIELFSRPGKNHWVTDLIEAQQGGEWEELVKIWSTTQVLAAVEVEAEEGEEEVVVKELK